MFGTSFCKKDAQGNVISVYEPSLLMKYFEENLKSLDDFYKPLRMHVVMYDPNWNDFNASLAFAAMNFEKPVGLCNINDRLCHVNFLEMKTAEERIKTITERLFRYYSKYSPKNRPNFSPDKMVKISQYRIKK